MSDTEGVEMLAAERDRLWAKADCAAGLAQVRELETQTGSVALRGVLRHGSLVAIRVAARRLHSRLRQSGEIVGVIPTVCCYPANPVQGVCSCNPSRSSAHGVHLP
jgi:hypothetical protein